MAISNNSTGLRTGVCTSTTRPQTPYEGQVIYETDTDLTYVYSGSAWISPSFVSTVLTGTPTAPTAAAGTNTTQIATTAFVAAATTYVPFRYQAGSTSGSGTFTVTFASGRFTAAPMVVSQSKSIGSNVAYDFTNVPTTSGFTIERNVGGTWTSQWIAIQATSGAGAGP